MRRWLDEYGPDYPESHVALIDALRNYIRCCDQITEQLLHEGQITAEEARAETPHMERCRTMLREIEDRSFDPSLCGLLQDKA